jgi:hypothetical protein
VEWREEKYLPHLTANTDYFVCSGLDNFLLLFFFKPGSFQNQIHLSYSILKLTLQGTFCFYPLFSGENKTLKVNEHA